ncbi:MAG: ATP-binding protein [bacterium]
MNEHRPDPDPNERLDQSISYTTSPEQSISEKAADLARKALEERPKISIRMQIYFSFALSLIVILGIGIPLIMTMRMMESKIEFLGIADNYLFEIHNARRFEKNYFLYGTNLSDALDSVRHAETILKKDFNQLKMGIEKDVKGNILPQLERYAELLASLTRKAGDQELGESEKTRIESELRRHGQEMIAFAEDLMHREKMDLRKMSVVSRYVYAYSLLFLLLFIVFNNYFLGRRILSPINRFVKYAQRIADGDYTPIMPARPYRDEFSDLAIAFNHMIDELDHREDILVQSHKLRAVGTLTAGVAHELNNPVNNITLTAHMLLEDYKDLSDEERLDMVNDVVGEVARCKNIIRSLLDFARESESTVKPLDLGEVIEETVTLASNQINLKGARVNVDVRPRLPRIYGDMQQLSQVFLNLILNALDVTQKGGRIDILVGPSEDPMFLAVRVTDYGSGIPDHILPSIFDPFFTTKSKRGGTGLGLAVSQGIIAKHGGRIDVTSKVGMGTTFTVTLPVTSFAINL